MVIKYYCDRCSQESPSSQLRKVAINPRIGSGNIYSDCEKELICSECIEQIKVFLQSGKVESKSSKQNLEEELAEILKEYYYEHRKNCTLDAFTHDKGICIAQDASRVALKFLREKGLLHE